MPKNAMHKSLVCYCLSYIGAAATNQTRCAGGALQTRLEHEPIVRCRLAG
jgi:hypothetical protein